MSCVQMADLCDEAASLSTPNRERKRKIQDEKKHHGIVDDIFIRTTVL